MNMDNAKVVSGATEDYLNGNYFTRRKNKAVLQRLIYQKKAILSLNLAVLVKIVVFGRLHERIFNQAQ